MNAFYNQNSVTIYRDFTLRREMKMATLALIFHVETALEHAHTSIRVLTMKKV